MANKKRTTTDESAYNADEAAIPEVLNEEETKSGINKMTAAVKSTENAFDTLTKEVVNAEKTASQLSETVNRIYVYIGPSIKGVITNGSIFRGNKASVVTEIEARAKTAGAGNKMSKIERLIVRDTDAAKTREQLRIGGNGASKAFAAILSGEE